MFDRNAEFERAMHEMTRLLAPGVLGFYSHAEATEIFAYRDGQPPINIFSILVAEERTGGAGEAAYLGQRIKLKSLKDKGWTFGMRRWVRPIAELVPAFEHLQKAEEWRPRHEPLRVGSLVPISPQFVPADSTASAPWNKVLKNNFWSGSYVFEWMDPAKTGLPPLLENPPALQELSEAIQKEVPIRLASLSDRLGNVVVQLPVTALIASFGKNRVSGDVLVNVKWHPKATARPVRALSEMLYDGVISGYASAAIMTPEASLALGDGEGQLRGVLWDDEHRVVLAATGSTAFISTVVLNMHIADPEPRVFTIKEKDGNEKQIRIGLAETFENRVKAPAPDRGEEWTRRRIYRDEAARLAAERRFVQYRPLPGQEEAEHERALADIRMLLNRYGRFGAWLWDPFLSADDVLCTLFHCSHKQAELRALTAGDEPPAGMRVKPTFASLRRQFAEWLRQWLSPPEPRPSWAEQQCVVFAGARSNLRGLRLEFRMKTGQAGWAFHDRFLIFPKTEFGPLAWSLGTSVNSLGKRHHILQQVDDAQLVADAFNELWDQLDQPEHSVWKVP